MGEGEGEDVGEKRERRKEGRQKSFNKEGEEKGGKIMKSFHIEGKYDKELAVSLLFILFIYKPGVQREEWHCRRVWE